MNIIGIILIGSGLLVLLTIVILLSTIKIHPEERYQDDLDQEEYMKNWSKQQKAKKLEKLIKQNQPNDNRDTCIICGKTLGYTKETSVENRGYYVEGAGQLCDTCWKDIYRK